MEYLFEEGPLEAEWIWAFEPAFFNTADYLRFCEGMLPTSFYILDQKQRRVWGVCHFHVAETYAVSPYRAPFGSVDFAEGLNPRVLYDFLGFIEDNLRTRGVEELRVTNPPSMDDTGKVALLETFLINHDFAVINAEVSTVVRITDALFEETVRPQERTLIRRGEAAGLHATRPGAEKAYGIYAYLASWYKKKGYTISVEGAYIEPMIQRFPDRYRMFTVVDDEGNAVAASLAIRVKRHVLYNFLFAHDPRYNAVSPSRLLIRDMHNFCQEEGIRYLDLGTSALNRQPKFPLLDFKRHVGGVPVSKLTFSKRIKE